jgi:hypothetical protein
MKCRTEYCVYMHSFWCEQGGLSVKVGLVFFQNCISGGNEDKRYSHCHSCGAITSEKMFALLRLSLGSARTESFLSSHIG